MRLDDVTFAYAGEREVLSDFSLDVPQHGVLGIQGPSGRGKSTMLKLLLRYWDPQRGPGDVVRHAVARGRCACSPTYSGHDEPGNPPV